jgi:hypothetical protein
MFFKFLKSFGLLFLVFMGIHCDLMQMQTEMLSSKGSEQKWVIKNPARCDLPSGYVIYGNNVYISINQFLLQFSNDGKAWKNVDDARTFISSYRVIGGIAFGNNRFVCASWPNISTSTNGSTWKITTDSSKYFRSIAFGGGTFVIVGSHGYVLTSRNGEKWERHDVDTSISFGSIAYGNGRFVTTCEAPEQIMASNDGVTWSNTYSIDENGQECSVIFGNGLVLVAGQNNYRSSDGRSWSRIHDHFGNYVFFLNNQFISFGYSSDLRPTAVSISRDLSSRRIIKTDLSLQEPLLTYINGQYVAFDRYGFACASNDLAHWIAPNSITSRQLRDVTFGNGRFVATGDSGTILFAPTCSTWTSANTPTRNNINAVANGDKKFTAVGDSGIILTSLNGETWSRVTSGTRSDLNSVCFGNGLFVAAAYECAGSILVSENGTRWVQYKTGGADYQKLIYGNGKFVVAGNNRVFVSADGKRWERAIAGNGEFKTFYFSGNHFFINGYDYEARENIQLSSDDGKWWKRTNPSASMPRQSVPFGIGTCEIIDRKLFWQAPDSSLYSISSKAFQPVAVSYGNGHFVGVGNNGRIAILKAQYEPNERSKSIQLTNARSFVHQQFIGEMDRQFVFAMTITINGKRLVGEYRYLRQNKPLKLEGTIDREGVFHMKEYIENGKNTGSFFGKIIGSEFAGEWRYADTSRQLYFDGYASSEEQNALRMKSFRNMHRSLVGTYSVGSINGSSGANTLYGCTKEHGEWECSGSSIYQGRRESFGEYIPEYDVSIIGNIAFEIKDDLTMELKVNGQSRLNVPAMENRLVYFDGSTTIARNITIKELGYGSTYILTCSNDFKSFSLEGNPTLSFYKIQK